MGGLGVLFIEFVLLAIFVIMIVAVRPKKIMYPLVGLYLVVLFGDALWGRYVVIPKLCRGSGIKVFKTASKRDGLFYASFPRGGKVNNIGPDYIEYDANPHTDRATFLNGGVVREHDVQSKAKYILNIRRINQSSNYPGDELEIKNRSTGEVMSRYIDIGFRGGWLEKFLGQFTDSGPQTGVGCDQSVRFSELVIIEETFK